MRLKTQNSENINAIRCIHWSNHINSIQTARMFTFTDSFLQTPKSSLNLASNHHLFSIPKRLPLMPFTRVTVAKRAGKKNVNKEGTGNRERLWLNFEVQGEDNRVFFFNVAYINFEISKGEVQRIRELDERLRDILKHLKVRISYKKLKVTFNFVPR